MTIKYFACFVNQNQSKSFTINQNQVMLQLLKCMKLNFVSKNVQFNDI